MNSAAVLGLGGLLCGFLLFRRMPKLPARGLFPDLPTFSIVIPARNEEKNLARLLDSIATSRAVAKELIVVDDNSTDSTASVAEAHGATVVRCDPPPAGWRGKPWACWQGAAATTGDLILFLDADTYFSPGGLENLLAAYQGGDTALSVLPFHATQRPYEELSLFFNLLMAAGAGGFSGLSAPKLFGQSLLLPRALYLRVEGHAAVRGETLENLALATHIERAGGAPRTATGKGSLQMRMFPEGFSQLLESWHRGAAGGAGSTPLPVLLLTIFWLSGAAAAAGAMVTLSAGHRLSVLAIYLLYAAQIFWIARRLGSFRWSTALFYPVPLVFYFAIFARSLWTRLRGGAFTWKGRQL